MYPLNDNDLDRLSREAAEQYDVEPGTSGWESLENRLNKELPLRKEKERRRFLCWLFLIVLLAGGGLLWTMTNKNNTVQLAHTESTIPAANSSQSTNASSSESFPNLGTTPAPGGTASTSPGTIIPQEDIAAGAPLSKTTQQHNATTTESNKLPDPSKKTAVNNPPTNPQPATRNPKLATGNRQPSTVNRQPETGPRQPLTGNWKPVTVNQPPATGIPQPVPPLTPAVTPAPENANIKSRPQRTNGFEIALMAGPDMSNVKFTNMDKIGYNVGLQVGYRITDHWSVNTGLLYTRKNYTVAGKDWTKTGWWRYTDMHSVEGYCKMFEIPLNVRYDIAVNKKQRWFAGTGASSYIMKSEYYNYDYTYNGARGQADWTRDSTSSYLFSILNISAGFEQTLSTRFSLQAEPYFKIPLKGLGYGKLNLNSYGINFSVKYKWQ